MEDKAFIRRGDIEKVNKAIDSLTRYEKPIISEVIKGIKSQEIGLRLHIAEKTVKYHLTNIYRKFGVANRVELILLVAGLRSEDIVKFGDSLYTPVELNQVVCPVIKLPGK